MRKFLTGSILIASLAAGGFALSGAAFATGSTAPAPTYLTNNCNEPGGLAGVNIDPSTQSGQVQACLPPESPEQGNVTADGSAANQGGYIVAQGNTGSPVVGYVGVSSPDGGVVGCYNSQFGTNSPGNSAPNNVIVPTPGLSQSGVTGYPAAVQAAVGNLQNAQTNPCTPAP